MPTKKELEKPDIPCFSVDEDHPLRLREITMLAWVCCVNPNPPQRQSPEDVPFTNPIKHKMVREVTAHLKGFIVIFGPVGSGMLLLSWMNSM